MPTPELVGRDDPSRVGDPRRGESVPADPLPGDGDDDGGAPWPAPATDDGVPDGDGGGVVVVVDAPDACAAGPGAAVGAAAAEAAVPSDIVPGDGYGVWCQPQKNKTNRAHI